MFRIIRHHLEHARTMRALEHVTRHGRSSDASDMSGVLFADAATGGTWSMP